MIQSRAEEMCQNMCIFAPKVATESETQGRTVFEAVAWSLVMYYAELVRSGVNPELAQRVRRQFPVLFVLAQPFLRRSEPTLEALVSLLNILSGGAFR